MKTQKTKPTQKPVDLELKPGDYQPSRKELEYDMPGMTDKQVRDSFFRPFNLTNIVLILACVFVFMRAVEWWETLTPETIADYVTKGAGAKAKEWWETVTPETITDYVAKGADVNTRDKNGWTPLHAAGAFNQNPAVIDALVRLGADVNALDENGHTPLREAARYNPNPKVINALLDAGANAKLMDNTGKLPADYAAENEHIKDSKAHWRLHEARY